MRNLFFLVTLSLLACLPAMARAQNAPLLPKPDDEIVLQLQQEDYVTAKTARIVLNVTAAQKGSDAAGVRQDMLNTVAKLYKDTTWRVTSFNQSQDGAGLVRWDAQLEARLPESALGKLEETAQKISKPGLQFRIGEVDFSPTLAEQEDGVSKLRTQIYQRVQEELARINTQFKGRTYRVARVDFVPGYAAVRPMMMKGMRNMAMDAAAPMAESAVASNAAGGMSVDQKITLNATATFAVAAP